MRLALQIIATLLTIAFSTAVWFGSGWLLDRMSFDFTLGMLFAFALIALVYFVSQWLDKSTPDATRTGQHKSPRHSIDL